MSDTCESSSVKPVIVRVKRKPSQSPVEAFWLEINERPLKKPLLDLAKLSISDSTAKEEELKPKKVLVQHVETVCSSEATIDALQSIVTNSADKAEADFKTKVEERRLTFKQENKQEQLLLRSREKHEALAKGARFEQIWKSRKPKKDVVHDDSLNELCQVYDVIRVDRAEEESSKVVEPDDTSLEENTILCNYMPLLRECLPDVAAQIQADMESYVNLQESSDDYVYDLYAVQEELKKPAEDALNAYPLAQVFAEDDFYDGPSDSDLASDDSNAEDNPLNDYPDEETSEEDEDKSETTLDESEELESRSSDHHNEERDIGQYLNLSEDEYSLDNMLDADDSNDDEVDWKWQHR